MLTVLGVGVSAAATYVAVRDVDFDVFWRGLRTSEWLWLVPAVLVLASAVLLRTWRWCLLFPHETRPPFAAALRALLIGQLFNNILPFRAGEAARIIVLHQAARTSRAATLGTVVVERLYDLLAVLLLLFVATPFLPDISWLGRAGVLAGVLVGLVLVLVVILSREWSLSLLRFVLRPLRLLPIVSARRLEDVGLNLAAGLKALHQPALALPAFGLTLLSWLVLAFSFWFVLVGFDLGLGFGAGLLAAVTTALSLVIPSLPAAIGVFEAATLIALRAYGVSDSEGLACAVVLHALNFFPYVLVGYIALHRHARSPITRPPGEA